MLQYWSPGDLLLHAAQTPASEGYPGGASEGSSGGFSRPTNIAPTVAAPAPLDPADSPSDVAGGSSRRTAHMANAAPVSAAFQSFRTVPETAPRSLGLYHTLHGADGGPSCRPNSVSETAAAWPAATSGNPEAGFGISPVDLGAALCVPFDDGGFAGFQNGGEAVFRDLFAGSGHGTYPQSPPQPPPPQPRQDRVDPFSAFREQQPAAGIGGGISVVPPPKFIPTAEIPPGLAEAAPFSTAPSPPSAVRMPAPPARQPPATGNGPTLAQVRSLPAQQVPGDWRKGVYPPQLSPMVKVVVKRPAAAPAAAATGAHAVITVYAGHAERGGGKYLSEVRGGRGSGGQGGVSVRGSNADTEWVPGAVVRNGSGGGRGRGSGKGSDEDPEWRPSGGGGSGRGGGKTSNGAAAAPAPRKRWNAVSSGDQSEAPAGMGTKRNPADQLESERGKERRVEPSQEHSGGPLVGVMFDFGRPGSGVRGVGGDPSLDRGSPYGFHTNPPYMPHRAP